jgi:hypothetical protein
LQFRGPASFASIATGATPTVDNASLGSVSGAGPLADAAIPANVNLVAPVSIHVAGSGADTIVLAPGIDMTRFAEHM